MTVRGDTRASSPDETLDLYEYEELRGKNAVRLLKLRPAGSKATEVECELVKEDLDTIKTEYEALSWSWGGEAWDHGIRIYHHDRAFHFPVPETLVAALKALRSAKSSRSLWIDAVCIDQMNADEKNKQGEIQPQSNARIVGFADSSVSADDGQRLWSGKECLRLDRVQR